MRARLQRLPASLLLLSCLSAVAAAEKLDHVVDPVNNSLQQRSTTTKIPPSTASSTQSLIPTTSPAPDRTTKDAPVDGKDGRPHAGPFVETGADRNRKQAKEGGEDKLPIAGKKPRPNDATKGEPAEAASDKALPASNNGVMDDPARVEPEEGTRGTEGGISEKSKDKVQDAIAGKKVGNTPEKPKEIPPLPHSEQEKLSPQVEKSSKKVEQTGTKDTDDKTKGKPQGDEKDPGRTGLGGLSKPTDLPDKPHDIPHPIPVTSNKNDPLAVKPAAGSSKSASEEAASLIQPLHSFLLSLTMILFSEIGDKTFLVAALMAMKHPPLLVFCAAFPALVVMTVGSAMLGHAVPTLLPPRFTNLAAAVLFLVFGAKMLREGYAISPSEGVGEEMREVEAELEEKEAMARKMGRRRSSITPYMLETGRMGGRRARSNSRLPPPRASPPSSPDSRSLSPNRGSTVSNLLTGVHNLCSLLLSPAWVQTFVMTFLGEWGDRSQIATIAMAAGQDYWWVTAGALLGHSMCTAVAVIGGRAIAGRVSLRVVTLGGAFAFLAFGFIYLAEAFYYE